jgi:ubiquinone/menaquinone biosynthesis C-methylase UbiE
MEDQRQYWNSLAGKREFTTPYRIDSVTSLISYDQCITDLGCGYGRVLKQLWEQGYRNLRGVDFSDQMIAEAGKNLPIEVELRVDSAAASGFEDHSSDAVLIYALLTCVTDPGLEVKILEEARRILKRGGTLFLNDFLINEHPVHTYERHEDRFGPYAIFRVDGNDGLLKHMSPERLKALLGHFEIISFEQTEFKTMHGNVGRGAMVTARSA